MYPWQTSDDPKRARTAPLPAPVTVAIPRRERASGRRLAHVMTVGLACAMLTVAGCATKSVANKGEDAAATGNWDAAVYYYLEALTRDPENISFKMELIRARQKAAQEHFRRGSTLRDIGRLLEARDELRMAVQLDPTHQFAEQELRAVDADLVVLAQPDGAASLEELKRRARDAKVKPPVLDPKSKEPITLNFPKAKPVKEIYRAMAKAYGFNVLFDPKLKDDEQVVELSDVTSERALEIVMQTAGHFYKVLDEHSIIVIEDNPQNRREYEDLVVKTFFLSNADVKEVDKLLRSLIEARRLSTNEQLNTITLRDTADKVAIAEQLININDKAKAEVLINVELLEANSTNIQELGTKLSAQSFSFGLDLDQLGGSTDTGGTAKVLPPNNLYLNQLDDITNGMWFVNVPSVIVNLIKSSTNGTTLAQPQMRITEGEKGSLVLGDRIPIPVTSFNTANVNNSGIVPITSFQYQDVGIKVNVEPRVHHNREVTLKVEVEVSQVSGYVEQNNQSQPIIGTRNINTVIRLMEGETNMLVGLYKKDASEVNTKIPGLSDIPLLGRLFTNKRSEAKVTDLILTLTPHIVRFPDIKESDLAPLWVGTESKMSFSGSNSPRMESGRADTGPFDQPKESPPPNSVGESKEEAASPFHTPPTRPTAIRRGGSAARRPDGDESGGTELVPGANKAAPWGVDSEVAVEPLPAEPVSLALEPSVVTLDEGSAAVLQVVVTGATSGGQVPLELVYDPARLLVEGVEAAPGFAVSDGSDDGRGRLRFALDVAAAVDVATTAVVIQVRGLVPGAAPLVFTDGGDLALSSGQPVVTDGSAVFVVAVAAPEEALQ